MNPLPFTVVSEKLFPLPALDAPNTSVDGVQHADTITLTLPAVLAVSRGVPPPEPNCILPTGSLKLMSPVPELKDKLLLLTDPLN